MKTNYLILGLFVLLISSCAGKTEKKLQAVDIKSLEENAVSLFSDNWFVVTAGNETNYNQMTISWGALGEIWGNPSATIYIRSTRHTFPYLNREKHFTLCAFDEEYRDKVLFIGSNSGRDINKIEATGLTPKVTELGNIYYDEARLVIECEKVYFNDINPTNIADPEAMKMYENETAMHRMFIGKIVNVWEKK
ncbi:flavin reductase family protein [Paludibacter sp. 221]|uniref:flavin reductase family protein n=1 Tax=Paludibacter sp. 221 TaxID=2302939 RepID=UPI0013D7C8E0|nr:flavin reductase [Paludibacter sp. 221]NDV47076.1 flavin reductase family protein [Paludibacter sp. 221]